MAGEPALFELGVEDPERDGPSIRACSAGASRWGALLRGTGNQSFVRGLELDPLVRDARRAMGRGVAARFLASRAP
jgi:hypothetical protein